VIGSLRTGLFGPEAELERRALLYGEAFAPIRRIGVIQSVHGVG
jgi:hypothetical protein